MKIWTVTFNDGIWNSYRPEFTIVADSGDEAIEKVLVKYPNYRDYDRFTREFKIEGYVIEVYDEKTYNREKKLDKLGI